MTLELIAFPTPGETLMTYCGYLVFQGKLNWLISIAVATAGVITGITISYFIGRKLGNSFFTKYGTHIHMGPEKLEKISKWFEKYGNGLLIVAYFIPGIRHVTGYFAGVTKIPYKRFAINAYIGAFLWTATFVSLGRILGANWEKIHVSIKKYLIIAGIIVGVILILLYLYKSNKEKITNYSVNSLENLVKIFQSLGKIRATIVAIAVIFVGLSILGVGFIQDFFANEFSKFDTIATYLVGLIFPKSWSPAIHYFSFLTTYPTLISIVLLMMIWIYAKGKNRILEARFLLITICGGEILEELIRRIFHRIGPVGLSIIGNTKYTFPSEQSLMAVVTYGFATFLILRYIKERWSRICISSFAILICFLSGLSPLYFGFQYPSDVTAGYVFGGVWLTLNIILMEVFRVLQDIKNKN